MIAVLVLNWNNAPDTLECLESIYRSKHSRYTVYVIDNGSTDNSISVITNHYPKVKIIANGSNLGFAEGNNRGVKKALEEGAQYLFLLNNDAIIHEDTLTLLEQAALDHPEGAVFGPKIYFYDQPTQIWYAGADFSSENCSFYHRDWGLDEREAPKRPIEPTGYICGCAFFIRKETIDQVGLMDPRYFLNWEEIDWCNRIQKHNHLCLYVPHARVWHKIGSSFIGGKRGPMWLYYFWRNRFLWLEKNIPLKSRLTMIFKTVLPQVQSLVKDLFDPIKRPEAIASLRGVRDYFLRRFGQDRKKINSPRR